MKRLLTLGLASEETKGTFYTQTNHDPASQKIMVNNVKYRSGTSQQDLVVPYPAARIADPA